MKKTFSILAAITMTVLACSAVALAQQSLGDAARQARKEKHPAATIRLEGQSLPPLTSADATPDDAKKSGDQAQTPDAKAGVSKEPKKSATEAQKEKSDSWRQKIDAQKKEITTLQRELDILMREQRIRAAAYYGDAGSRLRDSARYTEDSRKEQEDIDGKRQALQTAQEKLADLVERARKDGVSAE